MTQYAIKQEHLDRASLIVSKMSLSQKASLCSGRDFWHTKPIEELSVPSIMMTDGPHGLRKQKDESDHLGINESYPATCFPPAATSACSFDRELMSEMGQALAKECLEQEVSVLLGPAVNIKRSPLCGRNFEYFSEDPYLTAQMAKRYINGVQSKSVGASIKHYLANSQEKLRLVSDSVVDERALREIYLPAFEESVKQEQPWTVMCSYNKVNGTYASENKRYLTDILRYEWGFKGAVISDWGSVNNRTEGLEAGLDLEMPYSGADNDQSIVNAVKSGVLDVKLLDKSAVRLVALALAGKERRKESCDMDMHNELARRIARESAVLLKNDQILPIKKNAKVAVIGEFAKNPRYQGAGSSHVNSYKVTSVIEEFESKGINFEYAQGYDAKSDMPDMQLITEAVKAAKQSDVAILFVGLPDAYESEGYDRTHMDLPPSHTMLIESICNANKSAVAVIYTGSAVVMPWIKLVKGALLLYLTGQNNGGAVYDLLFGDYSPCGKLAETFPRALEDNPSYNWFAKKKITQYRESIYVGYRYYDKANRQVAFPFGHGLSYAKFDYSDITLDKAKMRDNETLTVKCKIKNSSYTEAKEIVQLYVRALSETVYRPERELKGFEKITLKPLEEKIATFELDKRSFAYWNILIHNWHVESGIYTIEIASSSRDIRLTAQVEVIGDNEAHVPDFNLKAPAYYNLSKETLNIQDDQFKAVLGYEIPSEPASRPYTINSTVRDIQTSFLGRLLVRLLEGYAKKTTKDLSRDSESMKQLIEGMIYDMPLRSLCTMTGGVFSREKVDSIVTLLNGNILRGLIGVLKK
ncbi:MAG TPA: glycoside hydrolase family 3 C-terminal domain-containing protein [Clostridia bacterium]|nr:glycoside hydrolase family 3 C-terminal domain-containing protein [Clostridia bacterium]